MFRTFNMGIGYVMVVGKSDVQKIIRKRKLLGEDAFVIGQIGAGRGGRSIHSTMKIGMMASGRGSNFQSIIDNVESGYINAEIAVLITDNPDVYALERAAKHRIESLVISPKEFPDRNAY
jgi:hypothetical protein